MYREPAEHLPTDLPPTELVLSQRERHATSAWLGVKLNWVTLLVLIGACIASQSADRPELAIVSMGLYLAYFVVQRVRRQAMETRVVLDGPDLCVVRVGHQAGPPRSRTPLSAVLDVVLDTKTVRTVQDSQTAIYALRYATARPGPTLDTSRVVIVSEGDRPAIALTESYLASFDATEQLGKVRAFLRKHGWVPEDERPESGPPSSG